MFKLGLTGSIGMGKSTTAQMFAELGCAVWDADAAVHRLYSKGGAAVAPMGAALPKAIVDAAVSRDALKALIAENPAVLKTIERIVHPLVGEDRAQFMAQAQADIVVLDIPLLFETGGNAKVDAVATVYIDKNTQTERVLARGTMTLEQLDMIRSKQLPAEEKRARADYVIETDTLDHAREQVGEIVSDIRSKIADA